MTDRDAASIKSDEHFMGLALQQAHLAASGQEVPVGAVVVRGGQVIAGGYNRRMLDGDPTAHAEMLAIRAAARVIGDWRLTGCTLYVTLEPCAMCAGAIVLARLDRVVYGATDPKAGAVETLYQLCSDQRLNHRPALTGGVRAAECSGVLTAFFQAQRAMGKK